MAANVPALIDKAKDMHRLSSDYKLALVMGISHRSLASYRHGMTLPDARVIAKLCELTGDDPAVVLAEVEEQRATSAEAKALWHSVAVRLQQAAAAGVFSVLAVVALAAGFPSGEAHAKTSIQQVNPLYIVEYRATSATTTPHPKATTAVVARKHFPRAFFRRSESGLPSWRHRTARASH